ncbi:MAG: hypothetical protein IJP13_08490 [Lachnospiraceae bacterium]|nr:hypothetical protein [Lachnospiraceae bacterium]
MYINEAVLLAMHNNDNYITREYIDNEFSYRITLIKPSNSYACCIGYTVDKNGNEISHCKCWNPTADDLTADDWIVVEFHLKSEKTERQKLRDFLKKVSS